MAKKQNDTKIAHFTYFKNKDYYEIQAISDINKLAFEGQCCHGIFLEFLSKAKAHKAEIVKKSKRFLHDQCKDTLQTEITYSKQAYKVIEKVKKLLKDV